MLNLNEFYHFLCCPDCKGELNFLSEQIICQSCETSYTYINGKPHLVHFKTKDNLNDAYDKQIHGQATHSLTEKIDEKIPGAGRVIRAIAHKISPPNTWGHYGREKLYHNYSQIKILLLLMLVAVAANLRKAALV